MAIFKRRSIQKGIDYLPEVISSKKLNGLIKSLNLDVPETNTERFVEALSAEWEIMIISALARIGNVEYERRASNGKDPDITFENAESSFIGDIFAVSDDAQNRKNPIDLFSETIRKLWIETGLKKGSLDYRVESTKLKREPEQLPPSDKPRKLILYNYRVHNRGITRLLLPPVEVLEEWVKQRLAVFFEKIREHPDKPEKLWVDEPYDENRRVKFSLSYSPNGNSLTGSHPSADSIDDAERHVLWRRLQDKKLQFANMTENVPRILIVCDGGSSALRNIKDSYNNSAADLVHHFFERPGYDKQSDDMVLWVERDISAVLLLTTKEKDEGFSRPSGKHKIEVELVNNPHATHKIDNSTISVLNRLLDAMPNPMEPPYNALSALKYSALETRRYGSISYNGNGSITVSLFRTLEMLAGTRQPTKYFDSQLPNPFAGPISIARVEIESCSDLDDDKATFYFGKPTTHSDQTSTGDGARVLSKDFLDTLGGFRPVDQVFGGKENNPFANALKNGRTISSINVETDGRLEILFRESDPASCKFQQPKAQPRKRRSQNMADDT